MIFTPGIEITGRNLQRTLWRELPARLVDISDRMGPVKFLAWSEDQRRQVERETVVSLPAPAEIWLGHHTRLHFPSIQIFRVDATPIREDDEGLIIGWTLTFNLDVAVVCGDEEALAVIYERYLQAIREIIETASLEDRLADWPADQQPLTEPIWQTGRDFLTDSGPLQSDSAMLRRGILEVNCAF